MSDHEEKAERQAKSKVEQPPAGIDFEHKPRMPENDNAKNAEVIDDEKEAVRREGLPNPADETPEAENPRVAEIESIIAAVRH